MRVLRKVQKLAAPRILRRFDLTDTHEPDPDPAPEVVFDRLTGPFGHALGRTKVIVERRRSFRSLPMARAPIARREPHDAMAGAFDEET